MLALFNTLEDKAEIMVETLTEGNKPLNLDTADILLLNGDEFITAEKGGISLIGNMY